MLSPVPGKLTLLTQERWGDNLMGRINCSLIPPPCRAIDTVDHLQFTAITATRLWGLYSRLYLSFAFFTRSADEFLCVIVAFWLSTSAILLHC